jgi:hypothetical protein
VIAVGTTADVSPATYRTSLSAMCLLGKVFEILRRQHSADATLNFADDTAMYGVNLYIPKFETLARTVKVFLVAEKAINVFCD